MTAWRCFGFDLLEREALFKCKKADEPFEDFLKGFPRQGGGGKELD
jgi:hypothetical protein